MDNKTTRPNGRSMNVIENSEDIQKRIEEAGYNFKLEAMQAEFSYDKVQTADSSNTSASSDGTKKAGEYTKVGATAILAFRPLIPEIVNGPKVKVKGKVKEEKQTEGPDMSLDD